MKPKKQESMVTHLDILKKEKTYGNNKEASESFEKIVKLLHKKFDVDINTTTKEHGHNLFDLLVQEYDQSQEPGTHTCKHQLCLRLIGRLQILLSYGLKPSAHSFNKLFLFVCYDHRHTTKHILSGLKLMKDNSFQADPQTLYKYLDKIQECASAEIVPKIANYISWFLEISQNTEETGCSLTRCITLMLQKANGQDNVLDYFPEMLFQKKTCYGHTLFSFIVQNQNEVAFKQLIEHRSFILQRPVRWIQQKADSKSKSFFSSKAKWEEQSDGEAFNSLEEVFRQRWNSGLVIMYENMTTIFQDDQASFYDIVESFIAEGSTSALEVAIKYLDHGAKFEGLPLVHYSIEWDKSTKCTEFLVSQPSVDINLTDNRGHSVLTLAMEKRQWDIVLTILEQRRGMNINSKHPGGEMPIYIALNHGQRKIVKRLLAKKDLQLPDTDR